MYVIKLHCKVERPGDAMDTLRTVAMQINGGQKKGVFEGGRGGWQLKDVGDQETAQNAGNDDKTDLEKDAQEINDAVRDADANGTGKPAQPTQATTDGSKETQTTSGKSGKPVWPWQQKGKK